MRKVQKERRRYKRFAVKAGAIVAFKKPRLIKLGRPKFVKLGPIVNISRGGLAVHYVESRERLNAPEQLSILSGETEIAFEDFVFKTVKDTKLADLPDNKVIRKLAIQFGDLKGFQLVQLDDFIRKMGQEPLPTGKEGLVIVEKSSSPVHASHRTKKVVCHEVLSRFKKNKAKAGDCLQPEWLMETYLPGLSMEEIELFEEVMDDLISKGVVEYVHDTLPTYKLTAKGDKIINKKKG